MNNLVVLHATPSELGAKLEACAEMMDVDTHQGIVYGVSCEGRVVGVRSGDSGPPVVDEDIPYGVRVFLPMPISEQAVGIPASPWPPQPTLMMMTVSVPREGSCV